MKEIKNALSQGKMGTYKEKRKKEYIKSGEKVNTYGQKTRER